jgi:hypothetical protein
VSENNNDKLMSLKNILITLGLSIAISLAYNLGKSFFGTDMTISNVIESFIIVLIAQFLFYFFINRNKNKNN